MGETWRAAGSGQMLPLGMQVTIGHPLGSFPSGQDMSSSAQFVDGQPPGSGGATVTGFWGSGQMLPLGMQVAMGQPLGSSPSGQEMSSSAQFVGGHLSARQPAQKRRIASDGHILISDFLGCDCTWQQLLYSRYRSHRCQPASKQKVVLKITINS